MDRFTTVAIPGSGFVYDIQTVHLTKTVDTVIEIHRLLPDSLCCPYSHVHNLCNVCPHIRLKVV